MLYLPLKLLLVHQESCYFINVWFIYTFQYPILYYNSLLQTFSSYGYLSCSSCVHLTALDWDFTRTIILWQSLKITW